MSVVGAADAFSRRPLPHGYRPFIGLTLKVAFGVDFARSQSPRGMPLLAAGRPPTLRKPLRIHPG